ncbi:MAG: 4Fe-4S dicluster domain-containing protein [bacterium]
MATSAKAASGPALIARENLQAVLDALAAKGYQPIGPSVRDGAIVYDEINSADDLPAGWTDEMSGGTYRLKRSGGSALFGYVIGPQSWKKYLHPPVIRLWKSHRTDCTFTISKNAEESPKLAFIGVRACELAAISVLDHVFLHGKFVDPIYRARRENILIIAVNCGQAATTCFCKSMKTGPRCVKGYDLALTELAEDGRHDFLAETGTPRGADILAAIPHKHATETDRESAARAWANADAQVTRTLDTTNIKELLLGNLEHPRWDQTAGRCLTCANCTMVCPTCFCTNIEDVTDLGGKNAERWRKWDSCFTLDFSYIFGGHVRQSAMSRYRQWMTHKLASWIDQFDCSGCVGCGRCITWCPVGIDITEEAHAIRETDRSQKENADGNP